VKFANWPQTQEDLRGLFLSQDQIAKGEFLLDHRAESYIIYSTTVLKHMVRTLTLINLNKNYAPEAKR